MSKLKKKLIHANHIKQVESMFQCPICGSAMKVLEFKSLVCLHNHTFDIAKQGYLNLTIHPPKNKYSKELFQERRKVMADTGFFSPLNLEIAKIIHQSGKETVSVIDMGCGEGSHLANICQVLQSQYGTSTIGVGIDLSKEGIIEAAKNYTDQIWIVADLANTPISDRQFDVILNILSPSNYGEFNRLLRSNGLVIKVVPQSGYLKELREGLFEDQQKQTYSNADTVERFTEHFQMVDRIRVSYSMNLDSQSLQSLVKMTPLTWSVSEDRIKAFLDQNVPKITVDLEILIGRKS